MIDYGRLEAQKNELRDRFLSATPFPHLVIDGLYEPDALREAVDRFPTIEEMSQHYRNSKEHKTALADLSDLDPVVHKAFDELNSDRFVSWLSYVTDIPKLLTDASNLGGGLHQSSNGMYLDVHADFNRHIDTDWFRRLNVLVYLNNWDPAMGGVLQLWDRDMSEPKASVVPAFNRMLVFATTAESFHGYEEIKLPPGGETRKSFAAYYYTEAPPPGYTGEDHSTIFRRRPGQQRRFVPAGEVRKLAAKVKRARQLITGRRS